MAPNVPRNEPTAAMRERATQRIDRDVEELGLWTRLDADDVRMAGELLARIWALGVDAGIEPGDWAAVTSLPVGILDALTVARRREARS